MAVVSRASTFVQRLRACGVRCCFVDDGARGSGGLEEMEGKLKAQMELEQLAQLMTFEMVSVCLAATKSRSPRIGLYRILFSMVGSIYLR